MRSSLRRLLPLELFRLLFSSTEPSSCELTARLIQQTSEENPSNDVSERMKDRISAIDNADADCGDDTGNDCFAWVPVQFHEDPAPIGPIAIGAQLRRRQVDLKSELTGLQRGW